jgi:pyruvate carboxylase
MRTSDLCRCADYTNIALANAFSLEMWGGATFDVAMRFLRECPWHRLETLREKVPDVPFQMVRPVGLLQDDKFSLLSQLISLL